MSRIHVTANINTAYCIAALLSVCSLFADSTPTAVTTPFCTPDSSTRCDSLIDPAPLALTKAVVGSNIKLSDGSITPDQFLPLVTRLIASGGEYSQNAFRRLLSDPNDPKTANQDLIKKATLIVNIVNWQSTADNDTSATPSQRWYVYHNGRLRQDATRIFGTRRFWFVYIHLNRGSSRYTVEYDFKSAKAIPQNVADLTSLARIIFPANAPAAMTNFEALEAIRSTPPDTNNIWGGKQLDFPFDTSDYSIKPSITFTSSGENSGSTAGKLGDPKTFHNEAASWWDVSIGLPVTNVNQLTFSQSGTNGALSPAQTDKKKLVGLLDLYLVPKQRYQIARNGFSWIPSFVVGLPLAGQPLQKPVAGLGWGTPVAQFYVGTTVIKQATPQAGSTVSGTPCTGWCPQFTFGVNFGVKAIASKLGGTNSN